MIEVVLDIANRITVFDYAMYRTIRKILTLIELLKDHKLVITSKPRTRKDNQ